jgi:hypothetical protein
MPQAPKINAALAAEVLFYEFSHKLFSPRRPNYLRDEFASDFAR